MGWRNKGSFKVRTKVQVCTNLKNILFIIILNNYQILRHAANLKQLDNGKKIPPSGWKCEKCDLTQNLWLNLTDGSILCGRKFYDGTGGNDHAVEHYRVTGY